MTESEQLNEQWKNGVLPQDYYYVQYNRATGKSWVEIELKTYLVDLAKVRDADYCSILAPAPSYEEYKALQEENAQLKEQLKECELWFTGIVGNMNDKNCGEHNRNLPIGNFEHIFKVFSQKINQVLGDK